MKFPLKKRSAISKRRWEWPRRCVMFRPIDEKLLSLGSVIVS